MTFYFEDLTPTRRVRTSLSEPFTLGQIIRYSTLVGLPQVRVSPSASPDGRPAVPIDLVTDRSTGLVYESGMVSASLLLQAAKKVTPKKPVLVGDRIYVVDTIVAADDRPGKPYGRVTLVREVFNQHNELVVIIEQDNRFLKRTAAAGFSERQSGHASGRLL